MKSQRRHNTSGGEPEAPPREVEAKEALDGAEPRIGHNEDSSAEVMAQAAGQAPPAKLAALRQHRGAGEHPRRELDLHAELSRRRRVVASRGFDAQR